jgi:hypothetical protein
MTHRQMQLDWLIKMASIEGFKAHAWHRAKEMDSDESGVYSGIASELERAMKRLQSERQHTGKSNDSRT